MIPLFIALVVPTLMLSFVDLDWINHDGLAGRLFNWPRPHESTLSYLRDIVGATFLPETWPPAGLSADMWQRLRPLIYWEQVRVTASSLPRYFLARFSAAPPDPPCGCVWANLPLQLVAVIAAIRSSVRWGQPHPGAAALVRGAAGRAGRRALDVARARRERARERRAGYGQFDGRLM